MIVSFICACCKDNNNKVQAKQTELQIEIDSGAVLFLISEKTYKNQWSSQNQPKLQSSKVKLQTYTKESIEVLGSITVEVTYNAKDPYHY